MFNCYLELIINSIESGSIHCEMMLEPIIPKDHLLAAKHALAAR